MVQFKATRSGVRWFAAATAALGLMLPQAALAQGGILDCLPTGQPLPKIPEIVATKPTSGVAGAAGVLRGTVLLANEKQRIVFREPTGFNNSPGKPGLYFVCRQQTVRVFRGLNAQPAMPLVPQDRIGDPAPGPTLRARLGDIVQLAFVNNINANQFPYSIDQGEKKTGAGCDTTTAGYPASANDTYPDCFHGSSTGNIHFHGTHTNPNATGDNVFLEIRPSPIVNGKPTVTDKTVAKQFNEFFKACYDQLKNAPVEWPVTWSDAPLGPWNLPNSDQPNPNTWTGQQALMLQAYDQGAVPAQQLWPQNLALIKQGLWPQFYIGAYPYCFQIPLKDPTQPITSGPLKMGQSPGMHWYHAHKHGSTAINVANGMTGVFVIEGATYDDKLNEWYGDGWMQRQPIMVLNQLGVSPNLLRGFGNRGGNTDKGPDFSVNGRIQPVVDMKPGEVQMWRIANTSGRSGAFFLGPPPGFKWRRIAQDGVQFADANYQSSENKTFTMAAGNRVDLLVQAPTTPALYPVVVQHAVDPSDLTSAYPVTLLSVRIKAGQQPVTGNQSQFIPTAPKQPTFLDDIADSEVQGKRTINFASTPPFAGQHTINGKKFDGFENAQKVFLNTVEEWTITNATANPNIAHPFHIHINPFQITQVFNPNVTVPNPTTGQPALPKYIFYLAPQLAPGQCYVDPTAINPNDQKIWTYTNPNDRATWTPCPMPAVAGGPRIWWDVFPIPSGLGATDQNGNPINGPPGPDGKQQQLILAGSFTMRSRFVDYPGYYVLHCHILAHEDRGMMTTVQLSPVPGAATPIPYKHH